MFLQLSTWLFGPAPVVTSWRLVPSLTEKDVAHLDFTLSDGGRRSLVVTSGRYGFWGRLYPSRIAPFIEAQVLLTPKGLQLFDMPGPGEKFVKGPASLEFAFGKMGRPDMGAKSVGIALRALAKSDQTVEFFEIFAFLSRPVDRWSIEFDPQHGFEMVGPWIELDGSRGRSSYPIPSLIVFSPATDVTSFKGAILFQFDDEIHIFYPEFLGSPSFLIKGIDPDHRELTEAILRLCTHA